MLPLLLFVSVLMNTPQHATAVQHRSTQQYTHTHLRPAAPPGCARLLLQQPGRPHSALCSATVGSCLLPGAVPVCCNCCCCWCWPSWGWPAVALLALGAGRTARALQGAFAAGIAYCLPTAGRQFACCRRLEKRCCCSSRQNLKIQGGSAWLLKDQ